ncbi:hypothetical protein QTP88_007382 [Uroleucon formosanum]
MCSTFNPPARHLVSYSFYQLYEVIYFSKQPWPVIIWVGWKSTLLDYGLDLDIYDESRWLENNGQMPKNNSSAYCTTLKEAIHFIAGISLNPLRQKKEHEEQQRRNDKTNEKESQRHMDQKDDEEYRPRATIQKCEYTDETENYGGKHSRADSEKRGGLKHGRHSFGQMFKKLYLSLFYSNIACTELTVKKTKTIIISQNRIIGMNTGNKLYSKIGPNKKSAAILFKIILKSIKNTKTQIKYLSHDPRYPHIAASIKKCIIPFPYSIQNYRHEFALNYFPSHFGTMMGKHTPANTRSAHLLHKFKSQSSKFSIITHRYVVLKYELLSPPQDQR